MTTKYFWCHHCGDWLPGPTIPHAKHHLCYLCHDDIFDSRDTMDGTASEREEETA